MKYFSEKIRCDISCKLTAGLLRSGKKVWRMRIFPGYGKVRKFCLSQENWQKLVKVREFQTFIKTEMSMAVFLIFRI